MQPHAGTPQLPKPLAQIGVIIGQQLFFDGVELVLHPFGHRLHGAGDMVDDGLEQRRGRADAPPGLESTARGIDPAQRAITAADHQTLLQHKAQMAGILGRTVDVAQQIGNHAIDAVFSDVELLIGVLGQQQRTRRRRNRRLRGQPLQRPGIGEVEMQPDQLRPRRRCRFIDRERMR